MNSQVNEFSARGVSQHTVNEQIKLATEPILQQFESLCAILADGTVLKATGIVGVNGSRLENAATSSKDNRYNMLTGVTPNRQRRN